MDNLGDRNLLESQWINWVGATKLFSNWGGGGFAIGRGRPTLLPSVGADPRVCPLIQGNHTGIAPTPRHPTENLQVGL
ncbi:MAG: hypothetical protein HC769_09465 [Cyanobacteria bacterium CRU_2_1]|nr:hypothetical protein [Cyanobacteria bacterium CRU_2_1]